MRRSRKFDPFHDKKVFHCKFCNFPISNPSFYPGKKLMINRYCPACHSVNSFPLLSSQDQKFLRAGFFSNPLYPVSPQTLKGVPLKFSLIFYPFSVFINFALNIVYMPFGLIYNNIEINKTNKAFYETYSNQDTKVIYLDMLRKRANNGQPYAAYLMGQAYLIGDGVQSDLEMAEHYFIVAKDEHENGIISLAKMLLNSENPNYLKAFTLLNLVKDKPQAAYYLAYLYYYGYGVAPSLRISTIYATVAYSAKIKDFYDIYEKVDLK